MPSQLACCTPGRSRWLSVCALPPPAERWSVAGPERLILSRLSETSNPFGRLTAQLTPDPLVGQVQVPGLRELEAQTLRPLHGQQRSQCSCLFFFLEEDFIGRGGLLQPVEIEVNQRRSSLGVVLCQGKGRAGDRFLDAQGQRQALHHGRLAGPQWSVQQQDAAAGQLLCQVGSEGTGGLQVVERPGPIATFRVEQARSLGVSAEIPVHVLPTELKIHGGSAHNHS